MWQRLKNWIHYKTKPPFVPEVSGHSAEVYKYMEGPSIVDEAREIFDLDHTPPGHKYSTSVRTEPVEIPLELAFVPRFPPKPVDCSDELFEEIMKSIRVALKGNLPDGKIIYYPRQRELYIQFPEEQVHCF